MLSSSSFDIFQTEAYIEFGRPPYGFELVWVTLHKASHFLCCKENFSHYQPEFFIGMLFHFVLYSFRSDLIHIFWFNLLFISLPFPLMFCFPSVLFLSMLLTFSFNCISSSFHFSCTRQPRSLKLNFGVPFGSQYKGFQHINLLFTIY